MPESKGIGLAAQAFTSRELEEIARTAVTLAIDEQRAAGAPGDFLREIDREDAEQCAIIGALEAALGYQPGRASLKSYAICGAKMAAHEMIRAEARHQRMRCDADLWRIADRADDQASAWEADAQWMGGAIGEHAGGALPPFLPEHMPEIGQIVWARIDAHMREPWRAVLRLLYAKGWTQHSAAMHLRISQPRVCQLRAEAIAGLRAAYGIDDDATALRVLQAARGAA